MFSLNVSFFICLGHTAKSVYSVPIHFRVREILAEIKDKTGFIFNAGKSKKYPNCDGPIHERRLLTRIKRLCDKLEIEGCLHSFRKFFCSYMANSGVPPATLIKWSGHQDLKVFMDHYYKLTDDESIEIMEQFEPQNAEYKTAENSERQSRDTFRDTLSVLKINVS
ncbi:MAG: hypothetical protein COA79_16215 [Planctomycetota bacterium]|nr:MAG: hypothetical protein COA79_16215 [Planctomycetota bacterium]